MIKSLDDVVSDILGPVKLEEGHVFDYNESNSTKDKTAVILADIQSNTRLVFKQTKEARNDHDFRYTDYQYFLSADNDSLTVIESGPTSRSGKSWKFIVKTYRVISEV